MLIDSIYTLETNFIIIVIEYLSIIEWVCAPILLWFSILLESILKMGKSMGCLNSTKGKQMWTEVWVFKAQRGVVSSNVGKTMGSDLYRNCEATCQHT